MLATGGTDAVVCLVETEELICLHTLVKIDNVVSLLSFSSDSQWIAFSEEGASDIYIASVATGEIPSLALLLLQFDCVHDFTRSRPTKGQRSDAAKLRTPEPEGGAAPENSLALLLW